MKAGQCAIAGFVSLTLLLGVVTVGSPTATDATTTTPACGREARRHSYRKVLVMADDAQVEQRVMELAEGQSRRRIAEPCHRTESAASRSSPTQSQMGT